MPELRPGPLTLARRLIARSGTRGPGEVLALTSARVREFIRSHDELTFYVRPAEGGPEDVPEKWRDLRLETAGSQHAEAYGEQIGTDSPITFRRRLTPETRCFLVLRETKIVHSSWVTTRGSWVREVRRYFRPPAQDAYVYESFTRAEVRGRGVYPFALVHICKRLAAEGTHRVWVGVESSNQASQRAVAKAGFEPGFRVSYRRLMGLLKLDRAAVSDGETCTDCLVRTIRI